MSIGRESTRYHELPQGLSALALALYLALSVTNLPPMLVLVSLILSGFCLVADQTQLPDTSQQSRYLSLLVAVGLLFASQVISIIFSYSPSGSLEAAVLLFPGLLIAYIMSQIMYRFARVIVWGVIGMILTACLMTFAMFVKYPGEVAGQVFQAAKIPALVVPNDMALGVVFSPLLLHCIATERTLFLRLLAGGVLLALGFCLYYVQSRTCFLAAMIVVALYIRHYFPRSFVQRFLAVLLVVFFVDSVFSLNIAQNFSMVFKESTRLAIWYAGLDSVKQHPLVGFGPAQFYIAYEQVVSSASLPDWLVLDPRGVPWAHNIFVEALTERGVIGLVVLLVLLYQIHSRLWAGLSDANRCNSSLGFAVYVAYWAFLFVGVFELTLARIWVANTLFLFIGFALTFDNTKNSIDFHTDSDPT